MPAAALRVALVDDDPDVSRLLALRLKRAGVPCETAPFASGDGFVEALEGGARFDLAFVDVMMPGMTGLDVLRHAAARAPDLPIVMVSAQGSVPVALEALEAGAEDYLVKGEDALDRAPAVARRAAERKALVGEIAALRQRLGGPAAGPEITGESPAMVRVLRLVGQAVRGDLAVAVVGESGTGKELVARALHAASARRGEAFVVLNCGAIPAELMESELFGHERGAFTGAHARRAGVFEQASGGTLFLDEIGELDPRLQAKLLRVLQDGVVRRVGGGDPFTVDVRVVSATHRDLEAMVKAGTFREDLFYRLVQFAIPVPPLRERGADVVLLADRFLADAARRHGLGAKALSAGARRALLRYGWPGNVRELKSAVERAALVADGEVIRAGDLALGRSLLGPPRTPAERAASGTVPDEIVTLDELKRVAVEHALAVCDGHVASAARALGVTRSTVYRLMHAYGTGA